MRFYCEVRILELLLLSENKDTTGKIVSTSLDEEEPDDTELPELETQVPVLHQSKRVSVPPSNYIPWMGDKTYVTNIQTKNTNHDEEKGLVYNHEARVWATVIATFNKCME